MPERELGGPVRVLIGVLGAAAVVASSMVGAGAVLSAAEYGADWQSVAIIALCVVVLIGGLALIRGAVRGRITVRRTR